jgi:hypothetical protein
MWAAFHLWRAARTVTRHVASVQAGLGLDDQALER